MPETLVLTLPIFWSAGWQFVYVAWGVFVVYAAIRWVLGLIPAS